MLQSAYRPTVLVEISIAPPLFRLHVAVSAVQTLALLPPRSRFHRSGRRVVRFPFHVEPLRPRRNGWQRLRQNFFRVISRHSAHLAFQFCLCQYSLRELSVPFLVFTLGVADTANLGRSCFRCGASAVIVVPMRQQPNLLLATTAELREQRVALIEWWMRMVGCCGIEPRLMCHATLKTPRTRRTQRSYRNRIPLCP